jgi:uncharacterized iron-regulated protein
MKQLLNVFLLFSTIAAFGQDRSTYKIYDTKKKKEISIDDIIKDFANADVLFFGEEHDDSIGHMLEAQVFEKAHKAYGKKIALSLEMFEADVQIILDEYLSGLILEKNLIKEGRAWKNYTDYKPLVEYAKANSIPVIAANTPARYTNAVTRNGLEFLPKFSRATYIWLPPSVDTATGKYYEKFLEIMGGHGVMPGMHIYQSQNLWDATMAYSMYKFFQKNTDKKVLHLNGRFHTDEKLGIPAQLKKYTSADSEPLKMLNISCFYSEGDLQNPDWKKHETLGDYIIITQKFKKDEKE